MDMGLASPKYYSFIKDTLFYNSGNRYPLGSNLSRSLKEKALTAELEKMYSLLPEDSRNTSKEIFIRTYLNSIRLDKETSLDKQMRKLFEKVQKDSSSLKSVGKAITGLKKQGVDISELSLTRLLGSTLKHKVNLTQEALKGQSAVEVEMQGIEGKRKIYKLI